MTTFFLAKQWTEFPRVHHWHHWESILGQWIEMLLVAHSTDSFQCFYLAENYLQSSHIKACWLVNLVKNNKLASWYNGINTIHNTMQPDKTSSWSPWVLQIVDLLVDAFAINTCSLTLCTLSWPPSEVAEKKFWFFFFLNHCHLSDVTRLSLVDSWLTTFLIDAQLGQMFKSHHKESQNI